MSTASNIRTPDLAGLQRMVQAWLLKQDDSLLAQIAEGAHAGRRTMADVYRRGYVLRLVESLEADFPGLVAIAGKDTFDALARAYIAARPSRHASLRWFGRELAAFLASTAPWSVAPALAEMARFEWAVGEAWDAPDAEPVQVVALLGVPSAAWETLSFTPVPSLRRLELSFDVAQVWQRREEPMPQGIAVAATASGPATWIIWRKDTDVQYRALDHDEAALLGGLIAGEPFPDLCARLSADSDDSRAVARAAGLLRAWVEAGVVGSFRYDEAAA
jgi:hypothetical protein